MVNPGILISVPVPNDTTSNLFFYKIINLENRLLVTNHVLPYYDLHWKNK